MTRALPFLLASTALAAPMAEVVDAQGTRITLTDEPCALRAVTNLPQRATWVELGKRHEGCFAVHSGIVVTYWDDRTVVIISAEHFRRLRGI